MISIHTQIRETLSTYAKEMFEFEAAPTQRGVPAGDRKDYLKFWRLTENFLSHLAVTLHGEFPDRSLICGKSGKKWLKLESGRRGIYLPYFGPTGHTASVPQWLSWIFTKNQIIQSLEMHPDGEALSVLVNSGFSFKQCFGFIEDERPTKVLLVDYATGKSSGGGSLDGNAHERLSYKMLQYLELLYFYERQEIASGLVVFGNGSFSTRRNRFYPSIVIQQRRIASMVEKFSFRFLVRTAEYLEIADQVLSWLHKPPKFPGAVVRRRPVQQ